MVFSVIMSAFGNSVVFLGNNIWFFSNNLLFWLIMSGFLVTISSSPIIMSGVLVTCFYW